MPPGKLLILLGTALIFLGIILSFAGKLPFWGRLPGDLRIERDNFSFYFPLSTCILISLLISLLLWLFRR